MFYGFVTYCLLSVFIYNRLQGNQKFFLAAIVNIENVYILFYNIHMQIAKNLTLNVIFYQSCLDSSLAYFDTDDNHTKYLQYEMQLHAVIFIQLECTLIECFFFFNYWYRNLEEFYEHILSGPILKYQQQNPYRFCMKELILIQTLVQLQFNLARKQHPLYDAILLYKYSLIYYTMDHQKIIWRLCFLN